MEPLSDKALFWIRCLCAIGVAATGYLLILLFSGKIDCVAGCGVGQGCVNSFSSKWSHWLGIPIIIPGLLLHCCIAFATILDTSAKLLHLRIVILGITALLAGLSAIWFGGILFFVEKQFCTYCAVYHLMSLGVFGIVIRPVIRVLGTCIWKMLLPSILLFGILILGQLFG